MATDQTDRQIRAALDDRAERGTARGAEAMVAAAWARHADPLIAPLTTLPTRRHRARRLAAVAAAVLLIAGYAVVHLRPDPDSVVITPGVTTTTTAPAPTWHQIGSLDIPDREANRDAVPIWTGSELVLAGLDLDPRPNPFPHPLAESPALDPVTGRIRIIQSPQVLQSFANTVQFWTGRELLVVKLATGPETIGVSQTVWGGAYDPTQDSWRTIATPPPLEQLVWAGDRAIGWTASAFVAYDPVTDRWSDLAPSSFRELGAIDQPRVQALWTGREVVAIGQATRTFDPASGAVTNAEPPPYPPEQAVWTGDRVLLYNTREGSQVAMFDPVTNTWKRGRSRPGNSVSGTPEKIAWLHDRLVVWGGSFGEIPPHVHMPEAAAGTASYDPATNSWAQLPPLPYAETQLNGTVVGNDLVVFTANFVNKANGFTLTAWKLS